jgi:hypothetical protein
MGTECTQASQFPGLATTVLKLTSTQKHHRTRQLEPMEITCQVASWGALLQAAATTAAAAGGSSYLMP